MNAARVAAADSSRSERPAAVPRREASAAAADEPLVVRQSNIPGSRLRLSVVVPCFNVGALAAEAVASLLAQTMAELEVIVVDDGSTDDTLQRVAALSDPRLTVITQTNRGLAGARNTGIRHARAELIGFCDGDDIWYPDKAAKHLAVMEHDPAVGLTFSYSAYLDERGAPTGQLLISRCRQPKTRDLVARNHVGNGSTPIVRRVAFAYAGLFDESLGSCEDMEMWVRLSVFAPFAMQLIPDPLTGYRVRAGSQMHNFEKYIAGSWLFLERFQSYVPGYTRRDADRTYAQHLRILSRKAFSSGQIPLSRQLLREALRYSPSLVVRDLRAFGMATLHVLAFTLPPRLQTVPYRLGRRVMRGVFTLLLGGQGMTRGRLSWGRSH